MKAQLESTANFVRGCVEALNGLFPSFLSYGLSLLGWIKNRYSFFKSFIGTVVTYSKIREAPWFYVEHFDFLFTARSAVLLRLKYFASRNTGSVNCTAFSDLNENILPFFFRRRFFVLKRFPILLGT